MSSTTTETTEVQAMQFNGLDDYLRIVGWMKDCGDTYALADEVRYSTPIMLMQTAEGTKAISPGYWIIRGADGGFYPAAADKPTVRTYRVQYDAGRETDGETETFIDAERYERTGADYGTGAWVTFHREGRIVAEIRESHVIVIEEMAFTDEDRAARNALVAGACPMRPDAERASDTDERDAENPQTDWAAYLPCPTCKQEIGAPCRFVRYDGDPGVERINPHPYRELLPEPAPTA